MIGLSVAACGYDSEKSVAIEVDESEDTSQHREIPILISEDGALKFDGQAVELTDISRLAGKSLSDSEGGNDGSSQPRFIVAVDENVEYERVVRLMDELQNAGAKNIEIAAAPK